MLKIKEIREFWKSQHNEEVNKIFGRIAGRKAHEKGLNKKLSAIAAILVFVGAVAFMAIFSSRSQMHKKCTETECLSKGLSKEVDLKRQQLKNLSTEIAEKKQYLSSIDKNAPLGQESNTDNDLIKWFFDYKSDFVYFKKKRSWIDEKKHRDITIKKIAIGYIAKIEYFYPPRIDLVFWYSPDKKIIPDDDSVEFFKAQNSPISILKKHYEEIKHDEK